MADTTETNNETALLINLANGSEEAFKCLYQRYWQKIFQVALYYLKDKEAAEDMVQEVFLVVWRKRLEMPKVQHFEKYVCVIARNLVISLLRKKMPVLQPVVEYTLQWQDDCHPAMQLEYKEASELVATAVNQLTPGQQALYRMNTEQQLPMKDAALQLNISYDSARQYKSEALKSLRIFLRKKLTFLVLFFSF